jgi:hypothetical protein
MAPPVPDMRFQVENYASRVKALSIVWFIYAALTLLTGVFGMTFLHLFMGGGGWLGRGPWGAAPMMPHFFGPAFLGLAWVFILARTALAAIAAWGLMERTSWGRIVAIVAAIFCLLKIPFGTALGIWTLVTLLGYRNSTLYEQL